MIAFSFINNIYILAVIPQFGLSVCQSPSGDITMLDIMEQFGLNVCQSPSGDDISRMAGQSFNRKSIMESS